MGERTLVTLDRRINEIRDESAEGRIDIYAARDRLIALDEERTDVLAPHFAPMPDFVRGFVQLANEAAEVLGRVHYVDVHHDGNPTKENNMQTIDSAVALVGFMALRISAGSDGGEYVPVGVGRRRAPPGS